MRWTKVFHKYTGKLVDSRENSTDVEFVQAEKERSLFLSRLSMALIGGLALIAPMLIMTLHNTRLTTLLTTSLFVIGVAVGLAWKMKDAKSQDIIAATAAYAAVLVVFVGTGTTVSS
jgi:uncharacterized membrane protein YqjE